MSGGDEGAVAKSFCIAVLISSDLSLRWVSKVVGSACISELRNVLRSNIGCDQPCVAKVDIGSVPETSSEGS